MKALLSLIMLLLIGTASLSQCVITQLNVNVMACNPGNNMYSTNGNVEFMNAPSSGFLIIEDCNGNQDAYPAPFTSPQSFNIVNQVSDGALCNITAYFSADSSGCNLSVSYSAPPACQCSPDVGTYTYSQGGPSVDMCPGDTLVISSNGDQNNPINQGPIAGNPYDPGLWFALYNCPPTTNMDPMADPCFVGLWAMDSAGHSKFIHSAGNSPMDYFPSAFPGGEVWVGAITMYSYPNLVYNTSCFSVEEIAYLAYHDQADGSFDYSDTSVCVGDAIILWNYIEPNIYADTGVFYGSAGLVIDSTTGWVYTDSTFIMSGQGTYTVTHFIDGVCPEIQTFDITIDCCPGIKTNEITRVEVYPNPANNTLYLKGDLNAYDSYEILSIDGRVHLGGLLNSHAEILISNLEAGIYVLRIGGGSQNTSSVFIKN